MEHQLSNTARVTIKVGNVTASSSHNGQVGIGSTNHVTCHPHVGTLGEGDGASVTHIGSKVHTLLEHIAQSLFCLNGRLAAISRLIGLGIGTGILSIINLVNMHARIQLIINLVGITFTLVHVHTAILIVGDNHGIVAPNAIIGVGIILDELVHVTLCLLDVTAGDAANADAQLVACDIGA